MQLCEYSHNKLDVTWKQVRWQTIDTTAGKSTGCGWCFLRPWHILHSLANTAKDFRRNNAKIASKTKLLGEQAPYPLLHGLQNSGINKHWARKPTIAGQQNVAQDNSVWPPCALYFADQKGTGNPRKARSKSEKRLGIRQLVHTIIYLRKLFFLVALVLRMMQEKLTAMDTCTNDVAKTT